ncbi:unnamed protein product [Candida verbasci]|uniref:Uncharacterized protein n=1 Tax=Candida verbasci TaxID=1227364 RepID=A0A9W4TU30_9ASCO|nr:unnamed protein product [Candida verbasci]
MFSSPFTNSTSQKTNTPNQFKENARNAIYKQLPIKQVQSSGISIHSAPSQFQRHLNFRTSSSSTSSSSNSSIFSSITGGKRSVRSAPSIYSASNATIPEDAELISITIEQLVNDIVLHEQTTNEKISIGSDLQYQNQENLIDWNLNVTRCKLILMRLPNLSSGEFNYQQNCLPQIIGDLGKTCNIILIQPHISDKEFIYTLYQSNLYTEHDLDANFKKSVAEISVKQSRLLQINNHNNQSIPEIDLQLKYKEIALRNYLVNLAAAATTAYEYKLKMDEIKQQLKIEGKKLTKDEKKQLWENVRSDVFKRAGLE